MMIPTVVVAATLAVAGVAAPGPGAAAPGPGAAAPGPGAASAHPPPVAAHPPPVALPAPTGRHPVGLATMHLRDDSRPDPWVPDVRRELMVSLWYPASAPAGRPAPYVTERESALLVQALGEPDLAEDVLARVRTHARVGAPPVRRPVPLVVLSPGFSLPRTMFTSLAEDLASRGYAVAGIDHNHEAIAITFPDGRVTECVACTLPRVGATVAGNRAADVSFVLDRLAAGLPGGPRLDLDRVAMVGHSIGGTAAVAAMRADPRIDAGVNMDGTVYVLPAGLDRPFLLLGAADHAPGGKDTTWDEAYAGLAGWRRWLTVDGAGHAAFTDHPPLADQLDLPLPDGQTLAGVRGTRITRAYVGAFLDRHLRDRPAPLLVGPSPRYPEVRFHTP